MSIFEMKKKNTDPIVIFINSDSISLFGAHAKLVLKALHVFFVIFRLDYLLEILHKRP